MKKVISIFLVAYYLLGVLFLPLGDFAVIKDLPDMYRHCRDTEDPDLDVFEFLTEHVSGIGQLIEGIEHEDQKDQDGDKPHAPVTFHFQQQISYIVYQVKTYTQAPINSTAKPFTYPFDKMYLSSYSAFIFRPPIA